MQIQKISYRAMTCRPEFQALDDITRMRIIAAMEGIKIGGIEYWVGAPPEKILEMVNGGSATDDDDAPPEPVRHSPAPKTLVDTFAAELPPSSAKSTPKIDRDALASDFGASLTARHAEGQRRVIEAQPAEQDDSLLRLFASDLPPRSAQ